MKLIKVNSILFSSFLIGLTLLTPSASAENENLLMDLHTQLQALGKEIDQLRGENEVLKHQLTTVKRRQKDAFLAIDDRLDEISVKPETTHAVVPAKPVVNTAAEAARKAKLLAIAKKEAELKALYNKRQQAIAKQKQWDANQKAIIARKQAELNTLKVGKTGAKKTPKAAPPVIKKTALAHTPNHAVQVRKAYYSAYGTFKKNKYQAIKEFDIFINKYPDNQYSEDAYFLIGDAYYAIKNYKEAINRYVYVLNKFKTGKKAPDAALKLAYSLYNLKDYELARETLTDVMKFFPNTNASKLAGKRLAEMKQAGH